MKLLVVSHACVTAVNQAFYAEIEQLTGWDVSLVVPASWNSEYQLNVEPTRWESFKGRIYSIPVWKSGNIPLHVYQHNMVGLLRKERPDVIYVHHEPYGLATAQVYLANRIVGNVPIGFYSAQNIYKKYPIPFRWFERFVLRRSNFCVPVNQGALDILRRKGYTGLSDVLPLPVDGSLYLPMPEWAAAKRAELGIGADEFVLGYMGRLVEEKGLKTMLLAARALRGRRWRCILVGSGPMEAELRALAGELQMEEQVIFAGFVPHVEAPGWLSLFDVLVLASETRPSWTEQFGRVLVEANACETAVIGTESGEIGNVLRLTGGGLIVPEADAAALGRAMLELAQNPEQARQLALRGAASVRESYSAACLAARFAALVRRACEQRG